MVVTESTVDFTDPLLDMVEHLEWVFQGRRGYLAVGLWNVDADKMTPKFFHWPKDKLDLYQFLSDSQKLPWTEVFFCPLLRQVHNRRVLEDATSYGVLWADVDTPLDPALLRTIKGWGARIVHTGRPGACHLYLRLKHDLTYVDWRAYQRAFRDLVQGDHKVADNDFLKIPGSWNYKNHQRFKAKGIQLPEPTLSSLSSPGRVVPDISKILEPQRDEGTHSHSESNWQNTPMPARIPDRIRAIMAESVGEDRSRQCMAAVSTIAEVERGGVQVYTREQCHVMLENYQPGVEKYQYRWHEEIDRIWDKWSSNKKVVPLASVDFWDQDSKLLFIRDYARATYSSPWATLLIVLVRLLHTLPWNVYLPTLNKEGTGGAGAKTVNLFVALIGKSGQGKLLAKESGWNAVNTGVLDDSPLQLGSGEGIPVVYKGSQGEGGKWRRRSAIFYTPEVTKWDRLKERQGATLDTYLLSGFSGEALGSTNRDQDTTVSVPDHEYRMSLIVGAQPHRCGKLFSDIDVGLPQRFVYVPTWDEEAEEEEREIPPPMEWSSPEFDEEGYVVDVWKGAREEIRQRLIKSQRRQLEDEDDLDSHINLVRLKVAVGLALLTTGLPDVLERHWAWSGVVMAKSRAVRGEIFRALGEAGKKENRRRARAKFEQEVYVEQLKKDWKADGAQTKNRILSVLIKHGGKGEWVSGVKEKVGPRYREALESALKELLKERVIQFRKSEYRGKTKLEFRIKKDIVESARLTTES